MFLSFVSLFDSCKLLLQFVQFNILFISLNMDLYISKTIIFPLILLFCKKSINKRDKSNLAVATYNSNNNSNNEKLNYEDNK